MPSASTYQAPMSISIVGGLESQPFKLKLKLGGPPHTMQVASLRSKHGGEWAQSGQLICSPQTAKLGFGESAFQFWFAL